MKTYKLAALFVALAACTPGPETNVSFRNAAVPITSIALFDPRQFSGPWDIVAAFGPAPCNITFVDHGGGAFDFAQKGCAEGTRVVTSGKISGPGRFSLQDGPVYWVMWVDQTYRTAVIGTPGGEFGMILNRDWDIPADRLQAAREILDWNGYDLARLQMRPKGE